MFQAVLSVILLIDLSGFQFLYHKESGLELDVLCDPSNFNIQFS